MANEVEIVEEVSPRGFVHLRDIETAYGATVSFGESSSAMAPHIWMWTRQPPPQVRGQVEQELGAVSVHMNLDQAIEIHANLGHMIEKAKRDWGIECMADLEDDE